jgi:MFS family permease
MMTVRGVGSVVGGLLAPRMIRRTGGPGTVAVGLAVLAAGLGGLVYPLVALGFVAVPFAGIGVSFIAVSFATLMQRRTPAPLMARVSTATDLLIGGPQIGSIAVGAVLISIVDYRWMFVVTAGALAVIAVALWAVRGESPPAVAVLPEGTPADGETSATLAPVGSPAV